MKLFVLSGRHRRGEDQGSVNGYDGIRTSVCHVPRQPKELLGSAG